MDAVKLVDREKGIIEGYAIPYGGPMNGRDLDGEAFDKSTALGGLYDVGSPVIYGHGLDDALGYSRLGSATKITRREGGVWLQAQLDKANEYAEYIMELLEAEALGFSSGAAPMGIAKDGTGMIKAWPWYETSLTPMPANPFAMVSVKSQQPVIGIKSQLAIFGELGRLPDADEALELARPYLKQQQTTTHSDGEHATITIHGSVVAPDIEERLATLERIMDGRKERLHNAELARLRLEHEHIMLEG